MNSFLVETTKKLIAVPSVSDKQTELKKCIALSSKILSSAHTTYFGKQSPSAIMSNRKGTKHFRIILNAHLDVVPGKPEQFKPIIKGDRLYGRGAYDMKAAAAVMIHVFHDIAPRVSYPLGLQLVTDEETGGFHGTKHQIENGIRADFVIAGEPTNFNIKHQAKGIIWADITFAGASGHGAYPWAGINAIEQAVSFVNSLKKAYPNPTKESWKTTVNFARIETPNKQTNVIPDMCTLTLDIRYIPEDKERILKFIEHAVPKSATTTFKTIEPAHDTSTANRYVQLLQNTTKTHTDQKVQFTKAMGASDLRHFSEVGVPGVEFGPVGDGHHTDHEWVSIKSLNTYYAILKDYILSLS